MKSGSLATARISSPPAVPVWKSFWTVTAAAKLANSAASAGGTPAPRHRASALVTVSPAPTGSSFLSS